ncbi:MAG: hypothetical protein C4548_10590 [Desulfobacteraceae bacterium]|nr:MAG: hypothetical protein C4548_10590 [Desulfobacteraceae bacterium]
MIDLPDIPFTEEASGLFNRLLPRIKDRLLEVEKVPVSVLLWGPGIGSGSSLASVRMGLRQALRRKGHVAVYSEEICDETCNHSIRLQQLAQAQEFDLIVTTPCTPGSVGEIHDFAADRRVNGKIIVFINRQYVDGYSAQSINAISTVLSCRVEYYPNENEVDIIENITLFEVQKIREMKYIFRGRY